MSRAVSFEQYGGIDVLNVVDVDPPEPGEGQILLRVKAAGVNPFDAKLRSGMFEQSIPVSFPALQGSEVAGVVERVAPGVVGFAPGDEILGATAKRGGQADLAVVDQTHVLVRPASLAWEVAGGLWSVATTAYASVAAVSAAAGDVVMVAGAAGAVGGLASQLARQRGATVIGVAGEAGQAWLRSRGVNPIVYGEGFADRLDQTLAELGRPLSALIDTAGQGYVEMAIERGIAPERINTLADYAAIKAYGVKNDGRGAADTPEVMSEVVGLIVAGEVELPIAAAFPLEQVREAYALLENSRPPGKIVLVP
ncbi:MAG TPA: NADP-dependent oxidoreductase [Solirubrobacteraceae bacterium]|jgi:NADPH:quinone reductase-like Zn-dependent oxidoreductase|nr:NADP-dependent oxidoreductase [Solirubrobacteraceae bacterium]